VSNTETKCLDQTTAIITHSSPGGTIGEEVAASCNAKLGFTSAFNGLTSISKIQDKRGKSNHLRDIPTTNQGGIVLVHTQKGQH
jgi:hypothetical protein